MVGHYKMLLGVKNFKKYNVTPYNEVQMSLLLKSKASMSWPDDVAQMVRLRPNVVAAMDTSI